MNRLVFDPKQNLQSNMSTFGFGNIPHQPKEETTPMPVNLEEADIVVDLNYIISEKPKAKIVRDFLRENLASIKSEEDLIFNDNE